MFSTGLQRLCGIEIPKVTIITKRQQKSCVVIHRHSPVPLSSENPEREPEWQECSQFSSIMSHEKNVKKLVNVNALLFRATLPDVVPTRARGVTSFRAIPQRRCKPVLNSPHGAIGQLESWHLTVLTENDLGHKMSFREKLRL